MLKTKVRFLDYGSDAKLGNIWPGREVSMDYLNARRAVKHGRAEYVSTKQKPVTPPKGAKNADSQS